VAVANERTNILTPAKPGAFANDSDTDLLTYMSWRETDAANARAAGGAFYDRHLRYVFVVCRNAAQRYFLGDDCVDDLVSETFQRVYEHAGMFTTGGITDVDQLRMRVRSWLGAIARNVVNDELRGRQTTPERNLSPDAWLRRPQEVAPDESALALLVSRSLEEALDDREREVIRVTYQGYKPGAEHQRLSNEDVAALAKSLQTTPDNLRKIRRNALLKIQTYVASHAAEFSGDHRRNVEGKP
jgi:RNA polymerase sigma factor (sigma-70 family)